MNPDEILSSFLDRQLYRIHDPTIENTEGESITTSDLNLSLYGSDSVGGIVDPSNIGSGPLTGEIELVSGILQSSNWVAGTTGWRLTPTGADINGGVSVSSIDIGGSDATSAHIDTAGNQWWGAADFASAPAKVSNAGAGTFSNMTITGGSVATGVLNKGVMGWTTNLVFSITDNDTVSWGTGTITAQDGTAYSISAGNTGNMTALTYIYLDVSVSLTVLQTTTTYSTATGDNKILIATAQNHTVGASVIPYGGQQPIINGTDQIAALSIVAGNIAANTITSDKISVSQLSAISANLGTITAGSITINSGVASIDSSGNATFKSVQVGGSSRQYTLNDDGIFSFGDGSDGDATCDGSTAVAGMSRSGDVYTLTRDVYFDDLTINSGKSIKTGGYRIFVQGTLTINGKVDGDGDAGTNGSGGGVHNADANPVTTGYGGTAVSMADGYLKGSVTTGAGGNGGAGDHGDGGLDGSPGANGSNTTNSLGSSAGGTAGAGGYGGILIANPSHGHPGAAGTGGTVTGTNVALIANWHLATLLDISSTGATVKFDNSASAPGGGGGAGGTTGSTGSGPDGGGGGAGGASGRIVAIYARNIVIGAAGSITANGGKGGDGGNGGATQSYDYSAGGGGGGGGGNGGIIIYVYNTLTNAGSITVTAGAAGAKGLKSDTSAGVDGDNGTDGNDGTAGSAGVIYAFQISL